MCVAYDSLILIYLRSFIYINFSLTVLDVENILQLSRCQCVFLYLVTIFVALNGTMLIHRIFCLYISQFLLLRNFFFYMVRYLSIVLVSRVYWLSVCEILQL